MRVLIILSILLLPFTSIAQNGGTSSEGPVVYFTVGYPNWDTTYTLTLHWSAVGDDGLIGTATIYDMRYGYTPITESNWANCTPLVGEPIPDTSGAKQQMTVCGVYPGVRYYYGLKVSDDAGNWSELSNIFDTVIAPPEIPFLVAVQFVADTISISDTTLLEPIPGLYVAGTDLATTAGVRTGHGLCFWLTAEFRYNVAGGPEINGLDAYALLRWVLLRGAK